MGSTPTYASFVAAEDYKDFVVRRVVLDLIQAINNELQRMYDCQLDQGCWDFEVFANMTKPLQDALVALSQKGDE